MDRMFLQNAQNKLEDISQQFGEFTATYMNMILRRWRSDLKSSQPG